MTRAIQIPREDLERLRRLLPGMSTTQAVAEALTRGSRVLAGHDDGPGADVRAIDPHDLTTLRRRLVQEAVEVAGHRFALVTGLDRRREAVRRELRSYEEGLALDRDVVPGLKLEAKELRRRIRQLEERARAAGIDVDAVGPPIRWSETIHVDGYEPPRYESDSDRRARTVAFFQRVGGR